MSDRIALNLTNPAASTDAGSRRFWKEALRVGEYRHPVLGWTLSVTPERMQAMAQTFRAMQAAGVTSDVTLDHSPSARDKLGRVIDAKVEGDSLLLLHELADDEAVTIAKRAQEVSLEIDRELRDSQGRTFRDAIVASSIVRAPVVPGQQPFRIAASRAATPAPAVHLSYAGRDPAAPSAWVQDELRAANAHR